LHFWPAPHPQPSTRKSRLPQNPLIITGNVVDAETRQPIPELSVTEGYMFFGVLMWRQEEKQRAPNGRYHLELSGSGPYAIKVESPGHEPEMVFGYPTNGVAAQNFSLRKGDGYSGTVLGRDGRAVKAAWVAYSMNWDGASFKGDEIHPGEPFHGPNASAKSAAARDENRRQWTLCDSRLAGD
jgi:hypothetical protein